MREQAGSGFQQASSSYKGSDPLVSKVTRGVLLKLSARLGWSLSDRETLPPAS